MPWHITNWAINAVYRRCMWFLFREEPVVLGKCIGCGRCCKEIVLHVNGRWLRTKRQLERAVADDPDLARFEMFGRDEDGRLTFSCNLQREDGLCSDYENRLDLCRSHPSKSLYYSGVVLSPYCGYTLSGPGVKGFLKRLWGRKPADFEKTLDRAVSDAGLDADRDKGSS